MNTFTLKITVIEEPREPKDSPTRTITAKTEDGDIHTMSVVQYGDLHMIPRSLPAHIRKGETLMVSGRIISKPNQTTSLLIEATGIA